MAQPKVPQRWQSHIEPNLTPPPPLLARGRFLQQRIPWPSPTCPSAGTKQPRIHNSGQILHSVTLLLCPPHAQVSSTVFSASSGQRSVRLSNDAFLSTCIGCSWICDGSRVGVLRETGTLQLPVSSGLCGDAWNCRMWLYTVTLCSGRVCSLLLPS